MIDKVSKNEHHLWCGRIVCRRNKKHIHLGHAVMNRNDTSPEYRGRRSLRLKDFDYSREGAYYVTICTYHRRCALGHITGTDMILNKWGTIASQEWYRSTAMRAEIESDAFIVMPNHIHGILLICSVGASGCSPKMEARQTKNSFNRDGFAKRSLASFIAGFKAAVTTRTNMFRGTPGKPFWQRNYYEHIIRDEAMLFQCRMYIEQNPLKWAMDKENPANKPSGG